MVFVEVDLNYPVHLHDDHRDFPLAPTKEIIQDDWLGEHQLELKEHHRLPSSNVKKLLQALFDKKTMHIITNFSSYALVLGKMLQNYTVSYISNKRIR